VGSLEPGIWSLEFQTGTALREGLSFKFHGLRPVDFDREKNATSPQTIKFEGQT
jgi:hypothetical protein